jgi:DTW domain-containing protein YfiP
VPTPNRVDVLILQHPLEAAQAKGSARLLQRSLASCTLSTGERFAPDDLVARFAADGRRSLLLYPDTPDIPSLSRAEETVDNLLSTDLDGLRLVVLDGTWRKCLKMLHLNPPLQALPRLGLQDVPPRRYAGLRRSRREGQLSTLEAVCLALERLEAAPARYAPLLSAFTRLVDRLLDEMPGRTEDRDCG